MPFYELVRKNHELRYALGGVDEMLSNIERSQVMRFANLTAAKGAATRFLSDHFYEDLKYEKWQDHTTYSQKKCEYDWHNDAPQKWIVLEVRTHDKYRLGAFEHRIYNVLFRQTAGYTVEEIAGLLNVRPLAIHPNINSLVKRKVITAHRIYTKDAVPITAYKLVEHVRNWDEFAWKLPNWYNNHAW